MKREGRQHGMVRSYRILPSPLNPRPNTRSVTRFDSPTTAGLFIKVPTKPTNHSKFTSKCTTPRCTGCHLHPSWKSKDKTKGTRKQKYWRVMDRPDSKVFGLSATGMLDHISNVYMEDEMDDEIGDQVEGHDVNGSCNSFYGDWVNNEDGGICISEIKFQFQMEQVEKDEDEDWFLVESSSHD